MPAINAAANPVNAVISPSAPNAGSSVSSPDAGDRPFATVLAEQSGKAPKSPGKTQDANAPAKATTAAESDADDAAPATSVPLASDVQAVIAPVVADDVRKALEGGKDEQSPDGQVQTAAEFIQAVLLTNGAGPAQSESTGIRKASSATALATATAEQTATPATDAEIGATSRGEAIADMRLAIARSASGETAPETGSAPAKLAATPEGIALQPEARSVPASDLVAAKSEAGMAQAAASVAAAVPAQVAGAVQPRHGGEYQIVTPLGSQHWETAVGNSLVIMSGAQQNRAELVLTPPQFGRIEVSISMKGDEATAFFVSANPAVRDALESALPRLREVLADAGITLGQTHVGAEPQGQSASERQNGDNASHRGILSAVGDGQPQSDSDSRTNAMHRVVSRTLVDTYA